ncbi:MAG TPA: hypothetical protein VNG51_27055 [Ktedonobacteraceae bacterium]|nr:hypothetical protein [Ktedonobacteraceae bacterium]
MSSDATPAYRGYRLQALYTLWRILSSRDDEQLVFQPEGEEDLAVFDVYGHLLEIAQVKAHEEDVTLSSLLPPVPQPGQLYTRDSFFYRFASLLEKNSQLEAHLICFGTLGPELTHALEEDGTDRKNVINKLRKHRPLQHINIDMLLAKLHPLLVRETVLQEQVASLLGESLMGVAPQEAFGLLTFWLYLAAEHKQQITRRDVIEKVNHIGRFLSERAAHSQEWFTSIVPLEDRAQETGRDVLQDEFYRGVSARYEHILAQVDIIRPLYLQEIREEFARSRVVIIHGASGQGKTSLAYRYLHDYFPEQWRFQVQLVEGNLHALRIARALVGHVDAINIPVVVYLDVRASDSGWPELVKQLWQQRNIQVLVTVREEDWRKATISSVEMQIADIALRFHREEAQSIYQSLREQHMPEALLTFQEAWSRFGGEGPLMEFVYLVTKGTTLRERLSQQVNALNDAVRLGKMAPNELALLRFVAVASAFEAHLKVHALVEYLSLGSPDRTIELLEQEYLLRRDLHGSLLYGLHPIRSAILVDLLTEATFFPWVHIASNCLQLLHEPDIEAFLLYAFSRRQTDANTLFDWLTSCQVEQWVGVGGVVHALLWLGIRTYIEANQQLIHDVFDERGPGWYILLDYDLTDAIPGSGISLWDALQPFLSPAGQQRIKDFQARQTSKHQVFDYLTSWLSVQTFHCKQPATLADWSAFAEVLFWLGRLGIKSPFEETKVHSSFDGAMDTLPLDVLADLVAGLSYSNHNAFSAWLDTYRAKLINRFRQETQTLVLEDDGQKLTAHFIVALDSQDTSQAQEMTGILDARKSLHAQALHHVELLRKLFPDRALYACQGYGHRVWSQTLPVDDTLKTGIPQSRLPLPWATAVNATFRGLAEQYFRPASLSQYAQDILQLRHQVLDVFKRLDEGLNTYFRSASHGQSPIEHISADRWLKLQRQLKFSPLLPSSVLDEWGFVDEITSEPLSQKLQDKQSLIGKNGLHLHVYAPLLNALREYIRTLTNFLNQADEPLLTNPGFGKGKKAAIEKVRAIERLKQQEKYTDKSRLSVLNLTDAVRVLETFQTAFRTLLSPYSDSNQLADLQRQEQAMFEHVWYTWYFFTYHPHLVLKNASQECTKKGTDILREMRVNLRREFQTPALKDVRISFISKDTFWKKQPALWLTVDGTNAVDVYNSIEHILTAFRKALQQIEDLELGQHVLYFFWRYIIVVPLVRGKCLAATAWRVFFPVLLQEEGGITGLNWWNFMPQPISTEDMVQFDLITWDVPLLTDATALVTSVTELSMLTGHIRDFQALPELNSRGIEQLQQYIQSIEANIGGALQKVVDTWKQVHTMLNRQAVLESSLNPNLVRMTRILEELKGYFLPPSYTQGRVFLTDEQFVEWANQLEKACEHALLFYLMWASMVLEEKN